MYWISDRKIVSKIRREIGRSMESENLEIKAGTFAGSSEVKVELEFLTEKNESTAIAQEIRNKSESSKRGDLIIY